MSMDFNLELRNNTCTITCQYFELYIIHYILYLEFPTYINNKELPLC